MGHSSVHAPSRKESNTPCGIHPSSHPQFAELQRTAAQVRVNFYLLPAFVACGYVRQGPERDLSILPILFVNEADRDGHWPVEAQEKVEAQGWNCTTPVQRNFGSRGSTPGK